MSDPEKNDSGLSPRRRQWLPIQIAPDDCDLELGRPHKTGILPLGFPCRRKAGVWFNVWADEAVLISPSHWRIWRSGPRDADTQI
jgi:hypothetical protein